MLTPAAAFRFSAPGVDKAARMAIRSGDTVSIAALSKNGFLYPLGTGVVDETDCHILPSKVDYLLTGRDLAGQLVDNAAVDAQNNIQNTASITLPSLVGQLIKGTRIPQQIVLQQVPNSALLWQTMAGETKINTLQRYLDFTNCLVWTLPDGRLVVGKPDFTKEKAGFMKLSISQPSGNNLLEARVKRNLNQAIRQIVTQLQSNEQINAGTFTVLNNEPDLKARANAGVGRSVYQTFSYGQGNDTVNTITQVGNQSGSPRSIGQEKSQREIARENMKILDVEAIAEGHFNDSGVPFNVDQIYNVQIEDEDVNEDLLVYSCSYELTLEHGMITRMRLCRLGTIVAYADALRRVNK
jgi:prophage tail gpP-like protein